MQVAAPAADVFPLSHAMQLEAFAWKFTSVPGSLKYFPAMQNSQSPIERLSALIPVYVPAGQMLHSDDPFVANFPAGHSVHSRSPLALKNPAPHSLHCFLQIHV